MQTSDTSSRIVAVFFVLFVFYLLFISHRSMSHRSKGVMVKGEQLPGNCVLLGKGSLMAPAGPALWAVACVCRDMQPCARGFLRAVTITPSWKP